MFISHGVDTQQSVPYTNTEVRAQGTTQCPFFFSGSLSYLRKAKTKNVRVLECWKYGLSQEKKASYANPNTKSSAQSSSGNQPGEPPEGSQVELPILRVLRRAKSLSDEASR